MLAKASTINMEYVLHKIESESSRNPEEVGTLVHQATNNTTTSSPSNNQNQRKRSVARISSSPKSQPFLSSYGSAFLSGIFADIAETSSEDQPQDTIMEAETAPSHDNVDDNVSEPSNKKARTTASISSSRQLKSFTQALAGAVEGASVGEVIETLSHIVSPRPNTSTLKIDLFKNDQVRQLQDMAFPSLPSMPNPVSSSSCSSTSISHTVTPRSQVNVGETTATSSSSNQDTDEQDGAAYGWFVSTDDDESGTDQNSFSGSMFLPDTKPDLAFKAITAPAGGDQDLEVQQALAADTVDDVLGDFF